MSSSRPFCSLVVCIDQRADELASLLGLAGPVYRCRADGLAGRRFSRWYPDRDCWDAPAADEPVPDTFSVLFFHTGRGDPKVIPADRTFSKEFAFSEPGVIPADTIADRPGVIAIRRCFPPNGCPVRERHVAELQQYVAGLGDVPGFCRHDETVPALWALTTLCQGYVAVGIAAGEILPDSQIARDLAWERVDGARAARLAGRLRDLWPLVRTARWWRESLGVSGTGELHEKEQNRAFLLRLMTDLEYDVLATRLLAKDLAETDLGKIVKFLDDRRNASEILNLLRTPEPTTELVGEVYRRVKNILEQR